MAHVVGVPKRDPCEKCELPVFLAERLTVGKKVFHRTCLKCARCKTQLTLGNFYETEVDNEFCCETCPDEEQLQEARLNNDEITELRPTPTRRSVRSSIADRLAFFEHNEDTVSRTDEEKSKSLKRLGETASVSSSTFKMSSAFNDYVNGMENGKNEQQTDETESEGTSLTSSLSIKLKQPTQSDDTTSVSSEEPPELPATPPPTLNVTPLEQEKIQLKFKSNEIKLELDNTDAKLNDKINNNDVNEKYEENINNLCDGDTIQSKDNIDISLLKDNNEDVTKDNQEHAIIDNVETNEDKNILKNLEEIREKLKEIEETDSDTQTVPKQFNQNINLETKEVESGEEREEDDENEVKKGVEIKKTLEVNNNGNNKIDIPTEELIENIENTTKIVEEDKVLTTEELKNNVDENIKNVEEKKDLRTEELKDNIDKNIKKEDKEDKKTEKLQVNISNNIIKEEERDEVKKELDEKVELRNKVLEESNKNVKKENVKRLNQEYPEDLNPFKSDDEEDTAETNKENFDKSNNSLNPFDSSDDEIELEKVNRRSSNKIPPPRPPPPRISRNPFGDDTGSEGGDSIEFKRLSNVSSSLTKKTPVPTPRHNLSQSSTPEPVPRSTNSTRMNVSADYYGSVNSLSASAQVTPQHILRNSEVRGSSLSLCSSAGGTVRSRKKTRAPAPPQLQQQQQQQNTPPSVVKELFVSNETLNSSKTSTPSSSNVGSPRSTRKKRPAPAPPKPARLETTNINEEDPKNLHDYPLQRESDSKLSDEEKALLEGKQTSSNQRRLIPLDPLLLADATDEHIVGVSDDVKQEFEEQTVVYRRTIQPLILTPEHEHLYPYSRQLEKLKENKEAQNRNRKSQLGQDDTSETLMGGLMLGYSNKSAHGKWKRRKGPAPALPVPPRRVLQMLPLQEIRHELEIIEVQQQGLEKQGVVLEKMIRDRCEGNEESKKKELAGETEKGTENVNPKEVEDLILQLFELVNEKNELFRRQAELMYLRRQHRLEQEQADLEYEIRVLMAQPERNKTDSDKSREEGLIARLVEVVQLRNEVIERLEMDRLREAEEDLSIKERLEQHNAKRESITNSHKKNTHKLSKKEKKRQKEAKKIGKSNKIDADKDADETELTEKQKLKKKKKKFPFLGNLA